MQRIDAPALAKAAGAKLTEALSTVFGVKEVRGLGLLIAVELDGIDAKVAADLALDAGLVVNAVTASAAAARAAAERERCRDRRGRGHPGAGARGGLVVTRHFLEIDDLSPDEIATVLDLSEEPIVKLPKVLTGQGVALVFEKPSARTRNSTEMAVVQLGGHPVTIRGDEVGFDVRESVEDVTRTLAGYHSAIAARVFEHRSSSGWPRCRPCPW